MADPEHLAILKRGVEAWNQWMGEQFSSPPRLLTPDLSGADLSRMDLLRANLHGADMSKAILDCADLRGADLVAVDLSEANLAGAYLTSANLRLANLRATNLRETLLSYTDLRQADLTGANLTYSSLLNADATDASFREAKLRGCDLIHANLTRATVACTDFSDARAGHTVFAEVDLSTCTGLETVEHRGPSTIGLDTFFQSGGKIPEVFLRGCGVPDIFLQYAASLAGKPFEFCSAFISYSSKDKELATRLRDDLDAKGVRCWLNTQDLKIGDRLDTEIDRAIRTHDKVVLLLSENSIGRAWVEHEVRKALEREREQDPPVLLPIRLDDAVKTTKQQWAYELDRGRHIGNFTGWKDPVSYQDAFEELLRALKAEAKSPTA
jgi:uncharacterized protein YjbI with pentapeptide repeats